MSQVNTEIVQNKVDGFLDGCSKAVARAKSSFVKTCRYFWYSMNFFEAEDLPVPIWDRKYSRTMVRIFNNDIAAQADALRANEYGFTKVTFQRSQWFPRVVKVIFHEPHTLDLRMKQSKEAI